MSLLGDQREQSRLVFNGLVGCYKQLAGPLSMPGIIRERSRRVKCFMVDIS